MKKIYLVTLSIVLLLFISCTKKEREEVTPVTPTFEPSSVDSASFEIDGKQYVFTQKNRVGIGNRAVNIKASSKVIPGGKLAYETGGYWWYGAPDSTMFAIHYGFPSFPIGSNLDISFHKIFNDAQLTKGSWLSGPDTYTDIFKLGKASFAVDFDKENTMDGILMDFYSKDLRKTLSTKIPGFSIIIRSDLKNDIQDNSKFEVTKLEKLENGRYLYEAVFEVNLFDDEANLYRVKNGYIRFSTVMNPGEKMN